MFRKTITIFALIGLILSLTAWGISYYGASGSSRYYGAHLSINGGIREADLALFKGRLFCRYRKWQNKLYVAPNRWRFHVGEGSSVVGNPLKVTLLPWMAKSPLIEEALGSFDCLYIWVPLYLPTLLFVLALCSYTLVSHCRRRMRRKRGLCVKCGYDLRGSKARCPECGREFEVPKPVRTADY